MEVREGENEEIESPDLLFEVSDVNAQHEIETKSKPKPKHCQSDKGFNFSCSVQRLAVFKDGNNTKGGLCLRFS